MTDHDFSDEEKALFRAHMKGVTPLKKSPKHVKNHSSQSLTQKRAPTQNQSVNFPIKKLDVYLSSTYHDTVYPHTMLSFTQPHFPNKRFHELKTGLIPRQAKLDLHGLRVDAAQASLLTFLAQQISLNHRCVLIIHGKGGVGTEAPVLKNLVNHWLRQIPEVLAFHSATPKEGGTGAVFVFLKRNSKR